MQDKYEQLFGMVNQFVLETNELRVVSASRILQYLYIVTTTVSAPSAVKSYYKSKTPYFFGGLRKPRELLGKNSKHLQQMPWVPFRCVC